MASENLQSIFETTPFEDWGGIRDKMGYPSFYDSLFEYERNKYQIYLNNYQQVGHYKSNVINFFNNNGKQIVQEFKRYICEKIGIDKGQETTVEEHEPVEQVDIDSCFNIPKEQQINIDDYNTQDEIKRKLSDLLHSIDDTDVAEMKRYLAYKSIEFAVKGIYISPGEAQYKRLKKTVIGKIEEYVDDTRMACVKHKLKEFYKKLTGYAYKKTYSKCDDWELTEECIREFIYFNKTPSFIVENVLNTEPEDYSDVLTLDGERYKYTYFIWRREGDPNTRRADQGEVVTRENFKNYSRFDTVGWSTKQLRTFFATNIVPIILQKCNIAINVNLPNYKNIIDEALYKAKLNSLIDEYINTNTISINMNYISEIREKLKDLSKDRLENISPYRLSLNMGNRLYYFISRLMKQQAIVQKSLQEKIINIKTRVANKSGKGIKYKWQSMCAKLQTWDIQQLRELAAIENIDNYQMKSKRELCKEFEEILQRKINDQRRQMIRYIPEPEKPENPKDKQLNDLFERHIQNNLTESEKKHKQRYTEQYSQKCQNNDSLSGDDLTDIKPEFFFTYKHNNKIFCDDIRVLYEQVIERGQRKSPYDRTPLSPELIRFIETTYEKLRDTMISLKDEEVEEEPIPLQSILTSKTTDLSGLLFAHAPVENFLQCDQNIFKEFAMYLEDGGVISNRESQYIFNLPDLQSRKIALVDLLTMKIRNDENVFDGISSMASNITDIYNSVFTDELESESTISQETSPSQIQQGSEDENQIIQRKAIIFISKLSNVSGITPLNITRTSGTKISDFIRYLIEGDILNIQVLYGWTQTNLLSEEGVPIEASLTKLKIELLQKLINIIEWFPDTAQTISNIIRTHNIFN
jgi:hypothetical protein